MADEKENPALDVGINREEGRRRAKMMPRTKSEMAMLILEYRLQPNAA